MAARDDSNINVSTSWIKLRIPVSDAIPAAANRAVAMATQPSVSIPTPELFARIPNLIASINATGASAGKRATSSAGGVTIPAELAEVVSEQRPIKVELTPQPSELANAKAILPIAYDDQFFYIAGPPIRADAVAATTRSRGAFELKITRLPQAGNGARASDKRINVFKAIKLGFFKIIGVPNPEVGLRIPDLNGGKVVYQQVSNNQLQGARRTALLVHGFLSETPWMVQALRGQLLTAGYGNVVTWDYETFTTPIGDISASLAGELRRAGASNVDVIAHSMGGLVTRTLAVEHPDSAKVGRALLMGTPNNGTPIANVGDLVGDLTSFCINLHFSALHLGPISAGGVVRFLWQQVERGLRDMRPDAPFIKNLNENPAGYALPLTILAGDSSAGERGTLFEKIFKSGTELFYGGPNDLVAGVNSIGALKAPPYHSVQTHSVNCNHFDYLLPDQPGRALVDEWVAK